MSGYGKVGGGERFAVAPTVWNGNGVTLLCDPRASYVYLTLTVERSGCPLRQYRKHCAPSEVTEARLDAIFALLSPAGAAQIHDYCVTTGWQFCEDEHHGHCCGHHQHSDPLRVGIIDGMPCVAEVHFVCTSHVGCHEAFEHNPATGRCRHKRQDGTCAAAERVVEWSRSNGVSPWPWSSKRVPLDVLRG